MKHGKLFWHSANERIGVYFEGGSSNDGLPKHANNSMVDSSVFQKAKY